MNVLVAAYCNLFLATCFSIEAIYGGYDWKPFGKGTRQIVVGRKRDIL
jgi:hypothetical protein